MLDKDKDGNLDFYEIKLNSELTEGILWDLSVQYYVVKKRFGDKIRSFNVVLPAGNEDWKVVGVKNKLEENLKATDTTRGEFLQILKTANEPEISMGSQCDLPYSCDFKKYCFKRRI